MREGDELRAFINKETLNRNCVFQSPRRDKMINIKTAAALVLLVAVTRAANLGSD
jgi:hypothetical protein